MSRAKVLVSVVVFGLGTVSCTQPGKLTSNRRGATSPSPAQNAEVANLDEPTVARSDGNKQQEPKNLGLRFGTGADFRQAIDDCLQLSRQRYPGRTHADAERRSEYRDDCMKERSNPRPFAEEEINERVDWTAAQSWWPFRPFLRSTTPPHGTTEQIYAVSAQGGTRGRSPQDATELDLVYESRAAQSSKMTQQKTIEAGAIWITARFIPESISLNCPNDEGKPIIVRGHPALIVETTHDSGGRDRRSLRWSNAEAGGELCWEIIDSSKSRTESELVAFVEDLDAVTH